MKFAPLAFLLVAACASTDPAQFREACAIRAAEVWASVDETRRNASGPLAPLMRQAAREETPELRTSNLEAETVSCQQMRAAEVRRRNENEVVAPALAILFTAGSNAIRDVNIQRRIDNGRFYTRR